MGNSLSEKQSKGGNKKKLRFMNNSFLRH
uniref:Uncharacterized protein n=1 Tax=Nelumbo nucifera TaxID=4432 RepID=A0A822ZHD4_NELNU|nr:TPA_asm: hypothetical protein HUJ06_001065 [Nelumbo nucifera]